MTIKILIADDHPIFRLGLRESIESHRDFTIVGEAENGGQALKLLTELEPDIAVLDINMPIMTGLDIIAKSQHWSKRPAFVLLTLYDDEAYLRQALEFNVLGYILKDNAESELLACLQKVMIGQHYISPTMASKMLEPQKLTGDILDGLTQTERKVFLLVGECKTSAEIAELLNLSVRTVQNHRANIVGKLGLRGHNALIKLASDYR